MQRFAIVVLCCWLSFTTSANAFNLVGIKPDDSFLTTFSAKIEPDKTYIRNIAEEYSGKYVVTEEVYADITDIDMFFNELSMPITLSELDVGKAEFRSNVIKEINLRNNYTTFKVLGGLSGYSAEFEPLIYFNIHRNITLVGGYVQYKKTHMNYHDAYWQYICEVQSLTKEIIPHNTRLMLMENFQQLENFVNSDKNFKIFLLNNGKIDSIYERGDAL